MSDFSQIQHPVSSLRMLARLRIAGSPDWVGIDSGAVWISNKAKHNIARIDAATNLIVTHVTVGRQPCAGLGVGFGSIWVPNCGDSTITRVETISSQVIATIPAGIADSEGSIGVGAGGRVDAHRRQWHPFTYRPYYEHYHCSDSRA